MRNKEPQTLAKGQIYSGFAGNYKLVDREALKRG